MDKMIVDFIPEIVAGDVKRTYDHSSIKFNKVIVSVLHQLGMFQGTLDDYQNVGCMDYLSRIPFSEIGSVPLTSIISNIKRYRNEECEIEVVNDNVDPTVAKIFITVSGVPHKKFSADLKDSGQKIKIINPKEMDI